MNTKKLSDVLIGLGIAMVIAGTVMVYWGFDNDPPLSSYRQVSANEYVLDPSFSGRIGWALFFLGPFVALGGVVTAARGSAKVKGKNDR